MNLRNRVRLVKENTEIKLGHARNSLIDSRRQKRDSSHLQLMKKMADMTLIFAGVGSIVKLLESINSKWPDIDFVRFTIN